MSATLQAAPVVTSSGEISGRTILLGLGLSSFSAMLLELGLTRLFSVVLFYHFAFLAISIALLGLGAGGVFACLLQKRLATIGTRKLAVRLAMVNSLVVVLMLEVVLHVPVALNVTGKNFLRLSELYLAAAVPFFLTGFLFSVVFARETSRVTWLYGADLTGGALACLAVVPLLNWMGGPNTILAAAMVMAAAAWIWSESLRENRLSSGLLVALLALITANNSNRLIDVIYAKGIFRDPAWVEFARWNALSRVEVDRQGQAKTIVIDADASTYIMNCDLEHWHGSEWERALMSAPPALANILRPHGEFAIIGPGGGVDVLRAVANGSPSVTGIEINPIIADTIMRGRYADYSLHLYDRADVHIHVTDGRSYLRSTPQNFDVVQMTLVDTWASTAAGAFALSENNLYTVEAFSEYFEHLKADGMIAITRWEFRQPREALRVVAVAMEALHRLGVAHPEHNFMVASQGPLNEDGIPVVVLAKKTAFNAEEEAAVREHFARYPQISPIYLPSQSEIKPAGENPFTALIASNDPYGFAHSYAYNVAPVSDNAPFFFFTLKAGQILGERGIQRGIDWKVNLGVLVLIAVLVISVLAVMGFLILPLAVGGGHQSALPLLYFVAIGLGYILVEIAFIQRFVLFLGHPTYALTVVIFLLMLSSGMGSLLSRRWLRSPGMVWIPILLVILALTANVFLLPRILENWVRLAFGLRLMISAGLLAPLGLAMGMPFPAGLRALNSGLVVAGGGEKSVEWAWAMNAGASVLGSALAIVIAIQFGLNATLACGVGAYFFALLFWPLVR
jgi:hypothetical protein